jgi:methionyl-tRNA formyltransferase
MKLPSEREWVVLFGGAERQDVVLALFKAKISVKAILVPAVRDERLSASILKLQENSVPVIDVKKGEVDEVLRSWGGAALLSVGFPYILPKEVIARHDLRLNVHPTLLPKYRGPTTGPYILINGERESGSTVHILDEEMDKGRIIVQSRVTISVFDTVRSLQRKVYATEPALVLDAIRLLDTGFIPLPQDESQASTYPKKRRPDDSRIDPSRPLSELYDQIRACDPDAYPAFFEMEGQKIAIKMWRPDRPEGEIDAL